MKILALIFFKGQILRTFSFQYGVEGGGRKEPLHIGLVSGKSAMDERVKHKEMI